MNSHPFFSIAFTIQSFSALFLLYYAVAIQSVPIPQLDRLVRKSDTPGNLDSLRIQVIGVRLAALLMEVVFFLGLAVQFNVTVHNPTRLILFVFIGMAFEILGRIFFPQSLPMRERDAFNALERGVFRICGIICYPISAILFHLSESTVNLLFPKTDTERMAEVEETIKSIIDVGEAGGIFKEADGEMLQSIVDFSETIVREVMTPRIDMMTINMAQPLDEFIQMIVESSYSKIPAYRDRIDNIEGILFAKDTLRFWNSSDAPVKLEDILRPAYFVPETKKVRDLLREFQKEKVHIAIVVDEYGGVAGLVTIEDLLEEIVGEIHDEYDEEESLIHPQSADSWIVDARMDLDELGDIIGIEFPDENYETLGGFLFDQMGCIPAPGETHQFGVLSFEILEANERRILKTLLRKPPKDLIDETRNKDDESQ